MATTLDALKQELREAEQRTKALAQAIAILEGSAFLVAPDEGPLPSAQDFRGLGIVDAAKRFISEAGEGKSTKEIADELLKRGMETSSKKWTATVYATLDNSPELVRTGTGRKGKWTLKEHRG